MNGNKPSFLKIRFQKTRLFMDFFQEKRKTSKDHREEIYV
jgi:hypothetical protein